MKHEPIRRTNMNANRTRKERAMSAPSKANISKLDNPARVTGNHRHGTESCV